MAHVRKFFPLIALLLTVVFGGLVVKSVRAGGWAVVTLEALPAKTVAERPFTIRFAVRQHGTRLMDGLSPTVTAVHTETQERVTAEAAETDDTGVYAATLTLPATGQWRWSIDAFTATYPMPPLTVTEQVPMTTNLKTAVSLPWILGTVALAMAAGMAAVWMRQRRRVWLAGIAAALLIGLGAFGRQWQQPQLLVAEETNTIAASAQMGEALFVTKGCVQCHQNSNVTIEHIHFSSFGPDLTEYNAGAAFLRLWLANPTAVKSETPMPNLNLSDADIEALIAFLQTDTE